MDAPLVSAVMVTGKSKTRTPLALLAVECFHAQSHPHRELVIVDTLGEVLERTRGMERVRGVPADPQAALGALRNMGLAHAAGQYIIQFDDDDWHDPERISCQMLALRNAPGRRCALLCWQVRMSLTDGKLGVYHDREGIHGTILHARDEQARYGGESKRGEDSNFLRTYFPVANRVLINNAPGALPDPSLYVRLWHGGNTWHERHVMGPVRPLGAAHAPLGARLQRLRETYLAAMGEKQPAQPPHQ